MDLVTLLQGQGPYARQLKKIETEISDIQKRVNDKIGIKESDTGLAAPNLWDIHADKVRQTLQSTVAEFAPWPRGGGLTVRRGRPWLNDPS